MSHYFNNKYNNFNGEHDMFEPEIDLHEESTDTLAEIFTDVLDEVSAANEMGDNLDDMDNPSLQEAYDLAEENFGDV